EKAVRIREKILAGEISFADAARSESDEKETKANGGILLNPATQDTRFELTRMDPRLYSQISNLKDNEVSHPVINETPTERKRYKEHVADYAKDYTKIKEMALQAKQMETIKKWFDEKLPDTYIKIDESYQGCDFQNNWLQK